MDIYASQPERALQIIDSAVILGNMNPLRADLLRAFIFSRTNEEMNYDSAILIGEQLMRNDSVLASNDLQEECSEINRSLFFRFQLKNPVSDGGIFSQIIASLIRNWNRPIK